VHAARRLSGRLALVAALVAALAVAAPAQAAASPAEVRAYVRTLTPQMNEWNRLSRSVSDALVAEPTVENGARMTTLSIEFRQLAERTAKVRVPAAFRSGHRSLVVALRHTGRTLSLVGNELIEGKPDEAALTLVGRRAEAMRLLVRVNAWKAQLRVAARRAGVAPPLWLRG